MARKRKAPSETDEIRAGRFQQDPTLVRLTRGDPEQLEEALKEFLGDFADDELRDQVKQIQEREDEVLAWLSAEPGNLDAFMEDPLGAIRTRFQDLELPPGRPPFVPARLRLALEPSEEADPVVAELFLKIWQYVAASAANTTAFETAPFSVIATVGATYPQDKVDKVNLAFEAVFGIRRLQTIVGVLNVAFEHARRP